TGGVACTGTVRTVTTWRSSPFPTAAADPDSVSVLEVEHLAGGSTFRRRTAGERDRVATHAPGGARPPRTPPPRAVPAFLAPVRRRGRPGAGDPARAAGHGVRRAGRPPGHHRPVHNCCRAAGVRVVRSVPGAGAGTGLLAGPGHRGDHLAPDRTEQQPG